MSSECQTKIVDFREERKKECEKTSVMIGQMDSASGLRPLCKNAMMECPTNNRTCREKLLGANPFAPSPSAASTASIIFREANISICRKRKKLTALLEISPSLDNAKKMTAMVGVQRI